MRQLSVSVVITVYNVEKYIDRCLNSVINQSFDDIEIIIVNDASPDKSMDVVRLYASEDKRIHIIDNPKNVGLMMARKIGYQNAKGKYIVFLDSDDTLPMDALNILFKRAQASNADVVVGTIDYVKTNGDIDKWVNKEECYYDSDSIYLSLLHNNLRHNLCGKMFSNDILNKYEYESFYQFTKWEDYCLFYQIVANINKMIIISDSVYSYYQTEGSSTQARISERSVDTTFMAHKLIFDKLGKRSQYYKLLVSQNQFALARLIWDYHCSLSIIKEKIKQFELPDFISISNIIKNNSIRKSIKLIIVIYLYSLMIRK